MLKSKIHRATVTQADVNYEGSVTVDADLLRAADILPHEEVHVWNVTRGSRLRTYAIAGEPGFQPIDQTNGGFPPGAGRISTRMWRPQPAARPSNKPSSTFAQAG